MIMASGILSRTDFTIIKSIIFSYYNNTFRFRLASLVRKKSVIRGQSLELEIFGNSTATNLNDITKLSKDETGVQTFAQLVAAALQRERWAAAEQPCVRRLRRALADANNFTLYAVWMLDALQLPSGQLFGSESHLGNYDECMEPRWRHSRPDLSTQYCLAEVQLVASQPRAGYVPDPEQSAETYLKTRTYYDLDLGAMNWGLCLPAGCPKSAVTKMYRILLRISHLGPVADDAEIDLKYCQEAGEKRTYDGVKMVLIVMASLLLAAVCSTYYVKNYKLNPKSYAYEILRSFCLERNYRSLTSVREDEVFSINVMRVFSSVIVVFAHYVTVFLPYLTMNTVIARKEVAENDYPFWADGTLAVDTFFAISGLMMVRGFLSGKYISAPKVVLKRYVRLVGVLSMVVFVKAAAVFELGNGPLWAPYMGLQRETCQRYGWLTLAMLQNLAGNHTQCLWSAWSTAVDFHLSVLAVVLCVIYRKNARLGIYIFALVFLVLLPIPGYIQNKHSIPVAFFYGFEAIRDFSKNKNGLIYFHTHTRAGPFLTGMAMGWVLAKYKPADYKKRISKVASYIYLVLCLVVMHAMLHLGSMLYFEEPTAAGSATFTSLFRTVFAAAVCGVVALAEYGDLGILNRFFKWSPWVPLSRLTYGVYIVNYAIAERNTFISRNSIYLEPFTVVSDTCGFVAVSFFFSFVLYLLVEGPSMNILSVLLDGSRGSKPGSSKTNSTPAEAETSRRSFEDKKIE